MLRNRGPGGAVCPQGAPTAVAGTRATLSALLWHQAFRTSYRRDMTTSAGPTATASTVPVMTAAERDAAIEHFATKLRYETDPSDVSAAAAAGDRFVLVDTRGHSSWHQGRARGAVHIPRAEIAVRAGTEIPIDMPVVVYCWGPACNGATRSAIEFLKLGYAVREMIGGFEYWAREGLGVVDDLGVIEIAQDRLTSALGEADCDC